jgi:hypothetical protein
VTATKNFGTSDLGSRLPMTLVRAWRQPRSRVSVRLPFPGSLFERNQPPLHLAPIFPHPQLTLTRPIATLRHTTVPQSHSPLLVLATILASHPNLPAAHLAVSFGALLPPAHPPAVYKYFRFFGGTQQSHAACHTSWRGGNRRHAKVVDCSCWRIASVFPILASQDAVCSRPRPARS